MNKMEHRQVTSVDWYPASLCCVFVGSWIGIRQKKTNLWSLRRDRFHHHCVKTRWRLHCQWVEETAARIPVCTAELSHPAPVCKRTSKISCQRRWNQAKNPHCWHCVWQKSPILRRQKNNFHFTPLLDRTSPLTNWSQPHLKKGVRKLLSVFPFPSTHSCCSPLPMMYSHLRGFFSQEQENAIFFLQTLTQMPLTLCASSLQNKYA